MSPQSLARTHFGRGGPGVEIQLTKGFVAIVDESDFVFLSQWSWCAFLNTSGRDHVYGHRTGQVAGRSYSVLMHRAIMCAPASILVDHINGNTLDNRKSNLRLCNESQNCANVALPKSGYRGVFATPAGNYTASISAAPEKKCRYLGTFKTAEEAARAFDAAAIIRYGEFARLNFPKEGSR